MGKFHFNDKQIRKIRVTVAFASILPIILAYQSCGPNTFQASESVQSLSSSGNYQVLNEQPISEEGDLSNGDTPSDGSTPNDGGSSGDSGAPGDGGSSNDGESPGSEPAKPPVTCQASSANPLAFPGVKGFGKNSKGGRGGQIIHVTNLNNSGNGSLRWALEDVSGPRIVVFDIEGRIKLYKQIRIQNPYVTLAGQTAPGDGIVVTGARLSVETHDVIIRGMSLRAGDDSDGDTPRERDNLAMGGNGDKGTKDVVIDHNSLSWSIDENFAIWGTVEESTISNNIIAQALNDSIHIDEGETEAAPHSMGFLIGHGEKARNSDKISIIYNLLASNKYRNAFIKGADNVEFLNNYIFNYGAGHQGVMLGGSSQPLSIAIAGNYYEDGKDTPNDDRPAFDFRYLQGGHVVYLEDNYVEGHRADGDPEKDAVHGKTSNIVSTSFMNLLPNRMKYQDVPAYVLANVGARFKSGLRDPVDKKIIAQVKDGSNRIIDKISEMGGYSNYNFQGRKVADRDGDGIPDDVEISWAKYGFDPDKADDKGDFDKDGYTNIEEYINGLITGFDMCP